MSTKILPLAREPGIPRTHSGFLARIVHHEELVFLLPVAVALVLGILFVSNAYGTQDDDGYIFYQYARNLATGHSLAFNPDQVSYGVTSGAWVGLLAAVHALLRADIVVEAQWLGLGLFALSAGLWALAIARWTGRPWLGLVGGGAYLLELDALKNSLNGLETGLNLAVIAALACLLARQPLARPLLLGAVCGLALLTRPDNAIWVACALGYAFLAERRQRWLAVVAGGAAVLVAAPWYGWLWAVTGSPIPPTQTGKLLVFLPLNLGLTFAEFQQLSVISRVGLGLQALRDFALSGGPITAVCLGAVIGGAAALLLAARPATRRYAAWPLVLLTALLLQAGLYAWSFPLVKLRYLISLLPLGLAVSLAAVVLLATGTGLTVDRLPMALQRAGRRAAIPVLLVLGLVGGVVYARELGRQFGNYRYYVAVQDVRADVGRWLHDHTPAGSLVALEPIGGVGFYAGRPVLDLGGLTDSSVWPALANGYDDPAAVARLLQARQAGYLVDYTHPDGIGGVSAALPLLPGARPVAVIESPLALAGGRAEYGSYTIYRLADRGDP